VGIGSFALFYCCDLDLDPIFFLYELDSYSMKTQNELSTWRLSKQIRLQTLYHAAWRVEKKTVKRDVFCCVGCIQSDFKGLTGSVRFDDTGLRRDYKMDVLEVNVHRGLAKVRHDVTASSLSSSPTAADNVVI